MDKDFTPGPWIVTRADDNPEQLYVFSTAPTPGRGDGIALIYGTRDNNDEANARLIAAAPEQLRQVLVANGLEDHFAAPGPWCSIQDAERILAGVDGKAVTRG